MRLPIPAAVLEQHVIALGKTGSGKSSKLRVLAEHLLDEERPVCILDPKGDWWGLKSSADGKRAGYPVVIFGGEHADVPLNPRAGAEVAEFIGTGNRSCIIDLSDWLVAERTRFFIDFASTLFRRTRGKRYLLIDEVHNFAPKGKILSIDAGTMLHWANKLAAEGRGRGITLIAASQRSQKVHNDFLTSCETLIASRVIHKADRDAIRDWIDGCADPDKGRQVLAELASMKRPEAWVWSPEIEVGPARITFPLFRTFDSFKPQSAHVGRLAGWADVDLEEVKARLAAVVAEAQENDPATLKARIRDLERQMRAQAGVSPEQLKAAEQEGFRRGFEAGRREGLSQARKLVEHSLSEAQRLIGNTLTQIRDVIPETTASALANGEITVKPPAIAPAPPRLQRVLEVSAPLTGLPAQQPALPLGQKLSKAERLILTALAQYPAGRTKVQVALLSGYAHSGGGFNNAISSLRSKGWIESTGDRLLITSNGLSALGPYDPLPHGQALLDHWLGQLGRAERAILSALAEVFPASLSKAELARRTGYEPTGGGFNNALSRLRTLELIQGRNELRASEDFFS